MTRENITEYKYPPISDQEFEVWKKGWDEKNPIPEQIRDYMTRVVFKRINRSLDDLDDLIRSSK
jgi:hypothetical protein